jgi:beta-RFAP synthase
MIDCEGLEVRIQPAAEFTIAGPFAERVERFARAWQAFHRWRDLPCKLTVLAAPAEHTGLGLGTQLGMSVAAGLSTLFDIPLQTPAELAISVGRGQRSAVGTYGFALGGLIVERGKRANEPISPLDCHLDLPTEWGVFLARARGASGLANLDEVRAMSDLPPPSASVTDQLENILRDRLVPAAARSNFDSFSAAVFDYGRLSGELFAPLQGGPYNGPLLTRIVELFRSRGLTGVGQSSWGPTIFAFTRSHDEATTLRKPLSEALGRLQPGGIELSHGPINQKGAKIKIHNAGGDEPLRQLELET